MAKNSHALKGDPFLVLLSYSDSKGQPLASLETNPFKNQHPISQFPPLTISSYSHLLHWREAGEKGVSRERGWRAMADDASAKAERERIFKRFDANGDGKISSAELGDALKTLGSVTGDEVKRMMAEIDTDGDGFISHQEFTDFALANPGLMKDVAKIF
ncbi:hypothetical protein NL676_028313 [Syzygium grande]|nr:hypothetical protein NL676_028313 [Syzygium grande]